VPLLLVGVAAGWANAPPLAGRVPRIQHYPIRLTFNELPTLGERKREPAVVPAAAVIASATGGADQVADAKGAVTSTPAKPVDQPPTVSALASKPAATGASAAPLRTVLIGSNFDLGAGARASDAIEVKKPVVLNGHAAGSVLIRIGSASQVFVRRSDLVPLLGGKFSMLRGDGDFVTLDQIRDAGVDVRYSSTRDTLDIGL